MQAKRHAVDLTAADIIAKIEGVKAYQSQVSTFWQSEMALAQRVRNALFIETDSPAEIYYQLYPVIDTI